MRLRGNFPVALEMLKLPERLRKPNVMLAVPKTRNAESKTKIKKKKVKK